MADNKVVVRVLLRHNWKKGLNGSAAAHEICSVEGEGAVDDSTAKKWFQRLRFGDTDIKDKPRSGRPSVINDEAMRQAVEDNPNTSTRRLSGQLGPSQSTIIRHLHEPRLVLCSSETMQTRDELLTQPSGSEDKNVETSRENVPADTEQKQQESKHWKEVFGHSDDDDDDKEADVNPVKKKRMLCGISPALPFENRSLSCEESGRKMDGHCQESDPGLCSDNAEMACRKVRSRVFNSRVKKGNNQSKKRPQRGKVKQPVLSKESKGTVNHISLSSKSKTVKSLRSSKFLESVEDQMLGDLPDLGCDKLLSENFQHKRNAAKKAAKKMGDEPDVAVMGSSEDIIEQRLNEVGESVMDYQIMALDYSIANNDYSVTFHKGGSDLLRNKSYIFEKDILGGDVLLRNGENVEVKYMCDFCGQKFTNIEALKRHRRRHGEKRYVCDVCGTGFTLNDSLRKHKRIHTGEKPYKCDVCGGAFTESGSLKKHKRIHTGEKPYVCDVCNVGFTRSSSLKKHKWKHTGEKPFKCDVCGVGFSVTGRLQSHIRIHTGEKPYKCDVCEMDFAEIGALKKHFRIHTGEKPYVCDICGVDFTEKGSLKKHNRIHTGEKPYKCDVCGLAFTESGSLKKHKRIHTGEKPYKCDVCGVDFTESGSMKKHRRIHTGERPYRCDVCGVGFAESGSLNKHKIIHTGEKPFRCDVCGVGFTQRGSLKVHKLMHTGVSPYKCDICSADFNKISFLKAHRKIHLSKKM